MENEMIVYNLSARSIVDLSEFFRERSKELFETEDFRKLDLGFEVPDKFLQIGGPQPTVAQLAVLAVKFKTQINIEYLGLKTSEQIDAERESKAAVKPDAAG